MKHKKILIPVFIGIIIISGLFVYKLWFTDDYIIDLEAIDDSKFLQDKIGVVYFSTTLDSSMDKGLVIFINEEGEAKAIETDGLELGRLGYYDEQLFFQDGAKNYLLSDQLDIDDRDDDQHTGDYVNILEDGSFFSIFNSGMSEEGDSYRSEVYWYDHETLKKDVLPFFITSRGYERDSIYTLHNEDMSEEDDYQLTLSETKLDHEADIRERMTWEFDQEMSPVTNLFVENDHLYHIGEVYHEDEVSLYFYDWDLDQQTVHGFEIDDPMSAEEHYESIPYDSQKSGYLKNDFFYFMDGTGQIYMTDIHKGNTQEHFVIDEKSQESELVQIDWQDDELYVFYHFGNNDFRLDTYNIETGDQIHTMEIDGVDDILKEHPDLVPFDLLILN